MNPLVAVVWVGGVAVVVQWGYIAWMFWSDRRKPAKEAWRVVEFFGGPLDGRQETLGTSVQRLPYYVTRPVPVSPWGVEDAELEVLTRPQVMNEIGHYLRVGDRMEWRPA